MQAVTIYHLRVDEHNITYSHFAGDDDDDDGRCKDYSVFRDT